MGSRHFEVLWAQKKRTTPISGSRHFHPRRPAGKICGILSINSQQPGQNTRQKTLQIRTPAGDNWKSFQRIGSCRKPTTTSRKIHLAHRQKTLQRHAELCSSKNNWTCFRPRNWMGSIPILNHQARQSGPSKANYIYKIRSNWGVFWFENSIPIQKLKCSNHSWVATKATGFMFRMNNIKPNVPAQH